MMSSRCAAWSARVGKACRVVHATKAQQGLRRLLPTSSRTSCVDFILCLCNAAEQDTTGDGDQRRRQPRCDHGQSRWRSTSGPCRMVVSKKKKNKVKSNIQTEKKTMRCNKLSQRVSRARVEARPVVSMPTLQQGRILKRQRLQTALPVAPSRAESLADCPTAADICIYFQRSTAARFQCAGRFFPRLRNPTSLRPQRQPRVSPATFGNPGVAKNQGPSVERSFQKKPAKSRRARRLLVVILSSKTCSVDAGEAKWPRDQGRTPFLLTMLPERRVRHQTTAKRRHVGGMTCWMPGSWKADTRILGASPAREWELLYGAA